MALGFRSSEGQCYLNDCTVNQMLHKNLIYKTHLWSDFILNSIHPMSNVYEQVGLHSITLKALILLYVQMSNILTDAWSMIIWLFYTVKKKFVHSTSIFAFYFCFDWVKFYLLNLISNFNLKSLVDIVKIVDPTNYFR